MRWTKVHTEVMRWMCEEIAFLHGSAARCAEGLGPSEASQRLASH